MKLKLALLLTIAAAFFSFGVPAQAGTVSIVPQTPIYTGGNGTGYWLAYSNTDINDSNYYQVESWSYVWAEGNRYRDGAALDSGSDQNMWHGSNYAVGAYQHIYAGSCPYPGFHWFGSQTLYRTRQFISALGQWTSWTAWAWTPVSGGVYAQVCL